MEMLFDMSLKELMKIEVEISSKTKETFADAPASVTVFTRQDFKQMGISNLEELLNYVAGFQVLKDVSASGQHTYASARGSVFLGADVLFMLNGVRLNDYHTNSNYLQRLISLGNVERIEVMRGPGSALYGSNAYAGAVNIITSTEFNDLTLELGENDARQLTTNISFGDDDKGLAVFLNTFTDEGEDYNNVFDRTTPNNLNDTSDGRDGYDVMLTGYYNDLKVLLRQTKRDFDDYYMFGRGLNDSRLGEEIETLLIDASYEFKFTDDLTSKYRVSYQELEWDAVGLFARQNAASPFNQDHYLLGPSFEHEMLNFAVDFTWQVNNAHTLSLALSYELAESPVALNQSNYDIFNGNVFLGSVNELSNNRFVLDEEAEIFGLLLEDQWIINEQLTATIGMRYDDANLTDDASISPRVALVYNAWDEDRIKFMYGEAFLAPALTNLYSDNATVKGNPDLQSTTIKTIEMAYIHRQDNLRAVATIFHNQADDPFTTVQVPGETRVQRINAGEQKTDGLELEAIFNFTDKWSIAATYTHLVNNETTFDVNPGAPRPEDFIPNDYASLAVNYEINKWHWNINGFFRDEVDVLPEQDEIIVFNTKLNYQISDQLSIYGLVKNLFDEDYNQAALGSGLGTNANGQIEREIPMRSRWIYLGVDYKFDL